MKTFVITFYLLIGLIVSSLTQQAQAQELQRLAVTTMEAPRTVAVFPDHPDKAALIFESTLTNLRFDSQMDGIVQIRDESANGRYILIIEPFTQIISVSAPGFIQERLRIGNPQAREVRYFNVAPEERRSDVISVIFNVSPADARLFVDDQQTDINQIVQIEPGRRSIRLEQEGFRTLEESVNVNTTNTSFSFSLSEIDIVPVQIRSNVVGANVVIDGTRRGQIDRAGGLGLFLYPGSYAIVMSNDGYLPVSTTLIVDEIDQNRLTLNLVRNIGELQLNVTPSDAQILLNRQIQDRQGLIELIPGRYQLDIEKEGHLSFSETIEIGLDERVSREVNLVRNIGELQLIVSPSDAQIMINRQDYTGQTRIELAPGRYRLDVVKEYYEPYSENVDITLNQRFSRDISLEAHLGTLQFSVSPSDAQVELIDASGRVVNRWSGIQILRNVQAGTYKIKVTAEAHLPKEELFSIQRNQTTQVGVELEEGTIYRTEIVEVRNPKSGKIWMDRNLGASRTATSITDAEAYGDLYQWGREADGHDKRNSPTTLTLSSTDQPGHGSFIMANFDWRSPRNDNLWQGVNGVNNPCPVGYRIPMEAEWDAERASWNSQNSEGAIASPLKLPVAGYRSYSGGSLKSVGSLGLYWSGSVSGSTASHLLFSSSNATMNSGNRAGGLSVRCIKD